MFERLFDCPCVLTRQRAGPLLEERLRYLCYRADQGITRRILQETARSLLVVAEVLHPCLARPCLAGDDQRLRRGRPGNEGQGPGQLRDQGRGVAEALP